MFHNPTPKEKGKEHLYSIDNEVVDDMRIFTREYAKKIRGLPIIPVLPTREYQKRNRPQLEDSVLVEDLEELVEESLQEVDQPLNQLGPDTPYYSPIHTPIQSPPHSLLKIMAHVNANQPNPPPAWKARSPLNLVAPLHDLPQAFDKMLPKFDPSEKIMVDDH